MSVQRPGAPGRGSVLAPPDMSISRRAWLRRNLFRSWRDALVTIVLGAVLLWLAVQLLTWALTTARWGVITDNLRLFLIGLYPTEEAWRVWLSLAMLSVLTGITAGLRGGYARNPAMWLAAGQATVALLAIPSPMGPVAVVAMAANAVIVLLTYFVGRYLAAHDRAIPTRLINAGWALSLPITFALLLGVGIDPLPSVDFDRWGGLLLTFLLASVSIVLSFPVGVLLAVGRRSKLPVVRILCTSFIEVVRGVPLVSIIFLADLILPLFLPGDVRLDRVLRAMGGLTLFTAAYVAENVRGGLQAVPRGQVEAAQAIGLGPFQINRFIVLPQALRAVIPANVGLFISLLKDTTLVVIVGLLELLGIGKAVLAQPAWLGTQFEVYGFVAMVFFVLSYTMSHASYRLEATLGVGRR